MRNRLSIFRHQQFGELRTVTDEQGEPWFVGKDVAVALGYKDQQKALKMHVDDEDKLTRQIVVSGQGRNVIFINESGLYSLILSSKLPSAKQFKRWVTSEVLPQIRKTGGYIPTQDAGGRQLTVEELLQQVNEIIGKTIRVANAPASSCLTATEVARSWGLKAADFNKMLKLMGVLQRSGRRWGLAPQLQSLGLSENRYFIFFSLQGKLRSKQYMVWTETGVDYLNHRFLEQPSDKPKVIQLNLFL